VTDPADEHVGVPPEEAQRLSDRWFDLDRTLAFSDAVIAVAITLLVVTLDVPDVENKELGHALADLGPTVVAFVISFWLIAGFWLEHHQFGKRLRAFDLGLMRINLVFLFGISLISFGTALFGRYSGNTLALAIYTVILVVTGNSMWWLWRYAVQHQLVREDSAPHDQDVAIAVLRTGVFLAAIPLGLLTPWAPLIWLVNARAEHIVDRVRGRRSSRR
jgi:uncharacterized membrane protein